jgi:uncharacterized protein (TIGR00297 family)
MTLQAWEWAIAVNIVLGGLCFYLRLLTRGGSVAGFLIGALIWGSLGWQGWAMLLAFFFGGTAATKFQFKRKQQLGVAEGNQGRRRWKQAWANAGAGVACAVASLLCQKAGWMSYAEAWRWAFVACFASALSDTLSSEYGQLAGQMPRLITTGQEVPVGTDGGITRAGTLMGILGAALLSLLGRAIGLTPVRATLPLLLAGLSGNLLDSYLGATYQRTGRMSNDSVNFANTVGGALLGFAGFWFMQWLPQSLRDWGLHFLVDLFI